MSKYDVLGRFLETAENERFSMAFSDIEKVLGFKLPASASIHSAWWANERASHVQARAWMNAGFETEQIDLVQRRLTFRRVASKTTPPPPVSSGTPGMKEDTPMFKHATGGKLEAKLSGLVGALKGTFTIAPGWDLTKPSLDPEELDELDSAVQRTADLIEKGLSGEPM